MITKLFVSSEMLSLKAGSESIVMNKLHYFISVNVIYTVTTKKSPKTF